MNTKLDGMNLDAAYELSKKLLKECQGSRGTILTLSADLSRMLCYLKFNYSLTEKDSK